MSASRSALDPVEPGASRQNALLAYQHFEALPLRGLAQLVGTRVAETPIAIEDVNGEPLFHDYPLMDGGTVRGTIRCAANRRLGAPIVSVSHDAPGWSATAAIRMATEALHKAYPGAQFVSARLICYAYPKIGVRIVFRADGSASESEAIFDVSSGGMVSTSSEAAHQFTRYSLLGRLSAAEARRRVAQFRRSEEQIAAHVAVGKPVIVGPVQTGPFVVPSIFPFVRQGMVQLSPWCSNSPPGNSHYAQITDYFCVDASSQMLLEHYGWNYTQNQIATAMGTTAAQGGTTGAGLTSGFTSLTDNTLLLTFDEGATRAQQFQDAMTEIDANRPLFTQVPHHYRVCMGYQETLLIPIWIALGLAQSLYIFDPWPWNPDLCQPGAPYWESWATSPVMWFGIVHHA
jgi:hypothetical protein